MSASIADLSDGRAKMNGGGSVEELLGRSVQDVVDAYVSVLERDKGMVHARADIALTILEQQAIALRASLERIDAAIEHLTAIRALSRK